MALISFQEVALGFGGPLLLDHVDLVIESGERVGLLGRNGAGKTSLLKLLYGELLPDGGTISRQQGLRAAYLPQEVPEGLAGSVAEIVAQGLEGADTPGMLLKETWAGQLAVEKVISRMALDPQARFEDLSAGMKRRVLLARGLAREPNLLLLDEPTNHLDLEAITWLEDFLARWNGTLLFVTHDRAFLQRLASRIIEIDRGLLYDWKCDYATFVRRREAALEAGLKQAARFDKKLAQEEVWIRRGIEARRTRNEGRVRALKHLRELRRERREQPGKVRLMIAEARRTGKLVLEAEDLSFAYDRRPIVRGLTTTILRGDRVGIIGPNGSGKTTLLRLLLGELQPQGGRLRRSDVLEVAYFDQLRASLDETKTAYEAVGQGRDYVTIHGKTRQLISYMEDFLFTPDRLDMPVCRLSGGERNRLLLARLFTRPANLLVMDEPTNDLDLETLELLEDRLMAFHGTLLLVSHDREFLNNLATSTLALDGRGSVREYVGGYDDWVRQSQAEAEQEASEAEARTPAGKTARSAPKEDAAERRPAGGPRKLSYHEQRALEADRAELAGLPGRIQALEDEQERLTRAMAGPAFYQQEPAAIAQAASRLKEIEAGLAEAYERWTELERRVSQPPHSVPPFS